MQPDDIAAFQSSQRNKKVKNEVESDTAGPVINKAGVYLWLLSENPQSMMGNYQQATWQSEPVSAPESLICLPS